MNYRNQDQHSKNYLLDCKLDDFELLRLPLDKPSKDSHLVAFEDTWIAFCFICFSKNPNLLLEDLTSDKAKLMKEDVKKILKQEIVTQGKQAIEKLKENEKPEAKLLYHNLTQHFGRVPNTIRNQSELSHNENSNMQNF